MVHPIQHKVIFPDLGAWVEQGGQLTRFRIEGGNVGTFASVAVDARESQVLGRGLAAVLLGDDVVRLMGDQDIVVVNQAILTAPSCLFPDQLA